MATAFVTHFPVFKELLYTSSYLVPPITHKREQGMEYYPHFIDKEAETRRDQVTCQITDERTMPPDF